MRKSTFTKALFTTIAMSFCMTSVFAESATVNYEITVPNYLTITSGGDPAAVEATVAFSNSNAGTCTLQNSALTGTFTVVSNDPNQKVYLFGSTTGAEQSKKALFQTGNAAPILAFAKEGGTATATQIEDAASSSPAVANNPDVIAFTITPTTTATVSGNNSNLTGTYQTDHITYNMGNGVGSFTYVIGGVNVDGTFDTGDTAGTYKATLTMTNATSI
mgnify:CR=1 FL=1